jgi:acetolactate decarboxylase
MPRLALVLPLAIIAFLSSPAADTEAPTVGYEVHWTGELRTVHRDGDARPRVDLQQLELEQGGFALGALAGLRGEITVIDGKAYISRIGEDGESIEHTFEHEAPFLVYGRVASWQAAPLPEDVRDIPALERWLPGAAATAGLRENEPFPFKVETSTSKVQYHIVSNPDPAGVFTHHASTTHVHVVSGDGLKSGHIDEALLGPGSVVYLPQP